MPREMIRDHKRQIYAFGGDVENEKLQEEYFFWHDMYVRGTSHPTMPMDRLASIAAVAMRDDLDKSRAVPNGGTVPDPQPDAPATKSATAKTGANTNAGSID